jgi:hypothetical protein
LEVVYKALGRNGPNCNIAIKAAIEELELMVEENKFEFIQGKFPKYCFGQYIAMVYL